MNEFIIIMVVKLFEIFTIFLINPIFLTTKNITEKETRLAMIIVEK